MSVFTYSCRYLKTLVGEMKNEAVLPRRTEISALLFKSSQTEPLALARHSQGIAHAGR